MCSVSGGGKDSNRSSGQLSSAFHDNTHLVAFVAFTLDPSGHTSAETEVVGVVIRFVGLIPGSLEFLNTIAVFLWHESKLFIINFCTELSGDVVSLHPVGARGPISFVVVTGYASIFSCIVLTVIGTVEHVVTAPIIISIFTSTVFIATSGRFTSWASWIGDWGS